LPLARILITCSEAILPFELDAVYWQHFVAE
jgi:hypothetical protein